MNPRGKTVIVTGASSGIGAATARLFASAGAQVVVAARSQQPLQELASSLPGTSLAQPTDMRDQEQVNALISAAHSRFGSIDILINNAGIGLSSPVELIAAEDLQQVLEANLYGPLYAIQAALPIMRAQGRGQIINVSSVVAIRALPYMAGYAASKAALDRLSESLRVELAGSGISVTTVRPGATRTPFKQNRLGGGSDSRRVSRTAVPPELVAAVILRATRTQPRDVYITLTDRLALLGAGLAPRLTDLALGRLIKWKPVTS